MRPECVSWSGLMSSYCVRDQITYANSRAGNQFFGGSTVIIDRNAYPAFVAVHHR